MHDTLGHGKTQGTPCDLHRRPLRPSRFARIRRTRSAIAWRDTPSSRATAPWPTSSTSSAHSRRVAWSSASSRPIRPSSECRCRFSGVVRSLRGRGTHSAYPLRGVLPRVALTERSTRCRAPRHGGTGCISHRFDELGDPLGPRSKRSVQISVLERAPDSRMWLRRTFRGSVGCPTEPRASLPRAPPDELPEGVFALREANRGWC
jgi:hypothetical protein